MKGLCNTFQLYPPEREMGLPLNFFLIERSAGIIEKHANFLKSGHIIIFAIPGYSI